MNQLQLKTSVVKGAQASRDVTEAYKKKTPQLKM